MSLERAQDEALQESRTLRPLPMYIAVVAVFLDQVTKVYFRANQEAFEYGVTVIPGFFDLVFVKNRGAAGGIFQHHTGILAIVSLVMLVLMIVFRKAIFEDLPLQRWAFGLLLGGIIGNLWDRWRFGYVTDFLDFYIGAAHWPAFNVADSCICTGVGLYMLSTYRIQRRKEGLEKAADNTLLG